MYKSKIKPTEDEDLHLESAKLIHVDVDNKPKPVSSWNLRRFAIIPFALIFLYIFAYYTVDHETDDLSVFDHSITHANASPIGSVALVFVAHDREEYFRESMESVFRVRGIDKVDIIVSMDYPQHFDSLNAVIDDFSSSPSNPVHVWKNVLPFGHYLHTCEDRITFHYGQILERAFNYAKYDYVILLESDLVVSPDFLEMMFDAGPLLADPVRNNLMCVSGWNDNGMQYFRLDESRMFRTDFFPGLGWMLHRSVWADILRDEWPLRIGHTTYDVWLRTKASTRVMDCLVPEVPRTHHIAKHGTNVNGKGHTWYDMMRLASGTVRISKDEINLVGSIDRYAARIKAERIASGVVIGPTDPVPANASSVIVLVDDEMYKRGPFMEWLFYGSTEANRAPNDVREVNFRYRLFYPQFRSSHRGVQTVTLASGVNLTLVAERAKSFWLDGLQLQIR